MAGTVGLDGFSLFVTGVICISVVFAALLLEGYLRREHLEEPEWYVLILLSASGGVVMASANDLIVLFLGLEILSVSVYVLAAMHARRVTSQEAGMKYFVLGAFSSAFLLYGIAFVYGATGTTNLAGIQSFLADEVVVQNGLLLVGLAFMLVGFGFKVAGAPFHLWVPDVYQGAPTPVVAYMACGGEGRRLRRPAAGLRRGVRAHLRPGMGADDLRRRRAQPPGGLLRRHRADQREADPGLQLDRPRGLHPAGRGGGIRTRARRRRCSTCSPTRSWWPAASGWPP